MARFACQFAATGQGVCCAPNSEYAENKGLRESWDAHPFIACNNNMQ
jgi:hypothetical protein